MESHKETLVESRGIIYIATGSKFVEEALISLNSVKTHMPDVPVSLFSDAEELVASPPAGVDSVILLESVTRSCRDKIRPLANSPYDKTLFLDTDTFLCRPVYDLFEMLDRFDIALAQAPDRYQYDLPDLPDCFTELNSGVIAYRSTPAVTDLFERWEETYNRMLGQDDDSYRDQHSLREALYRSNVQFFVLPPEYNFRTICPNFAGNHCSVKIIHGRHANLEKVASRLNSSEEVRVFLISPFRIFSPEINYYQSIFETVANSTFQMLPAGLRDWLSGIRKRFKS